MDFDNIPLDIRAYECWVVWKLEETESGRPTKVPYSPITHHHASSTNSKTWTTFKNATDAVRLNPNLWNGIGFVLSENDPYTFIDLDEPKNPDGSAVDPDEWQTRMDRQHQIYNEFDSYAELSPSGKGLHIIIKGSVPTGRKRSSIEIYSDARFMTMTGNVYRNKPIADYHELANILWAQMGKGASAEIFYAGLEKAKLSDNDVIEMAKNAVNGEKFCDYYYYGNWQKYHPSQSEADLSLINIIGFYSQNRAQIQRIFLTSKLAEREKSRAQYRINYALNLAFDRMLPPVDLEGIRNQLNEMLEAKAKEQLKLNTPIILAENYQNLPKPIELDESNNDFPIPPGLVGEIARYIYAQAPLPVPEIAVAAAIGLMAGICGKAYNVSSTGLNQYIMLVSLTGTGKESMASGIAKLMTEVKKNVPAATAFIGPGGIASEQALIKYLNNSSSSFVSIFGEFALMLKQMSGINANPSQQGVKRMFLDLYNKSGAGDQFQPLIYSDNSKSTGTVFAPAFTFLAESSPEIFYESLDESMISGGLLPRFIVIENKGDRTLQNKGAALVRPSFDLVQGLGNLCANALSLNHSKKVLNVQLDEEATKIMDDFALHCHNNIIGSKEIRRQLWNRAHIKALKLAALLAVGCSFFEPRINRECALWAINLVMIDVRNMSTKFEAGEIGADNDETKQLNRTMEVIKEYMFRPHSELVTYGVQQVLHSERIIPYGFLQKKLSQLGPFRRDKMGSTNALKRTLATMVARGDIAEVPKPDMMKKFNVVSVCYVITNMKVFGF